MTRRPTRHLVLMLDDCTLMVEGRQYYLAGHPLDPLALCTVALDALTVEVPVGKGGPSQHLHLGDFARVWAVLPTLGAVAAQPAVLRALRHERLQHQLNCPGGRC